MGIGIVVLLASAAVVEIMGAAAVIEDDAEATVEVVTSPEIVAMMLEVSGG